MKVYSKVLPYRREKEGLGIIGAVATYTAVLYEMCAQISLEAIFSSTVGKSRMLASFGQIRDVIIDIMTPAV